MVWGAVAKSFIHNAFRLRPELFDFIMALPSIARISTGLARSASLCRSMGTAATSPATAAAAGQQQSKPKKKAMASFDWTDALNLGCNSIA